MQHLSRSLVRNSYFYIVFFGANALALWLVASGHPIWLVPLALFVIVLSFIAERIAPYNADWNRDRDDTRRDVLIGVTNQLFIVASVLLIPLFDFDKAAWHLWPDHWAIGWQVLLGVVIVDLGLASSHFLLHRIDRLWPQHRLHHSMTRMYGFNGFMRHPTNQLLEFAPGALPLLFLGINLNAAFLVVFAVTVQLLLQHSNVDYRAGVFRYLIAVNEVHRLHHLRNKEGQDGVNYALFFNVWDMLLGRFRLPRPHRVLTSDDIGLRRDPG